LDLELTKENTLVEEHRDYVHNKSLSPIKSIMDEASTMRLSNFEFSSDSRKSMFSDFRLSENNKQEHSNSRNEELKITGEHYQFGTNLGGKELNSKIPAI
jgi:hypothetical protein